MKSLSVTNKRCRIAGPEITVGASFRLVLRAVQKVRIMKLIEFDGSLLSTVVSVKIGFLQRLESATDPRTLIFPMIDVISTQP